MHYAHLAEAMRPGAGGPSVLWGVHRDRIVVVKGVELPVLVGTHRIVHDVGGWRVQMLETKPSRDALTTVSK
jgi:hypothetical protein